MGAGGTGEWSGWDSDVAMWADGAWLRLPARTGWRAWVVDEGQLVVRGPAGWAAAVVDRRRMWMSRSGPPVAPPAWRWRRSCCPASPARRWSSSIVIPNRAIVFGVSTRTVTTVAGATSYDCGIAGQPSKFGGSLGVAAGSTNAGVIGPQAFYSDTAIRLTANGANFTGGAVRIAIHYATVGVPPA